MSGEIDCPFYSTRPQSLIQSVPATLAVTVSSGRPMFVSSRFCASLDGIVLRIVFTLTRWRSRLSACSNRR